MYALLTWFQRLSRRCAIGAVLRLKLLLQRLGIPARADIFFAHPWEWRYPPYLYLSVADSNVIECWRQDLPFFLTYGGLHRFLFRVRAIERGESPAALTIIDVGNHVVPARFTRTIRLAYNYYDRPVPGKAVITMPYFGHPDMYSKRFYSKALQMRHGRRAIRLLFAGGVNEQAYVEKFRFPLLNRTEILEELTSHFGDQLTVVRTRAALESVLDSQRSAIVFVLSPRTGDAGPKHILSIKEYFGLLARSDFFLAPPGVSMPHCHNIIEAMSVATIPVTNYGGYFSKPLKDGVDCLSFSTAAELVSQVERALTMSHKQVRTLRDAVIEYYDSSLGVEAFARVVAARADESLTIRVNAEQSV